VRSRHHRELMPARNLYIRRCTTGCSLLSFPHWVDEHDPVPSPGLRAASRSTCCGRDAAARDPQVHETMVRPWRGGFMGRRAGLDRRALKAHDRTIGVSWRRPIPRGSDSGAEKGHPQFVSTGGDGIERPSRAEEAVPLPRHASGPARRRAGRVRTMDETGGLTSASAGREAVFVVRVGGDRRSLARPSFRRNTERGMRAARRFLETGEGPICDTHRDHRPHRERTRVPGGASGHPFSWAITGVGAFVRDLTRRSTRSRRSKGRWANGGGGAAAAAVMMPPEPGFVKDRDGRFVLVNKRSRTLRDTVEAKSQDRCGVPILTREEVEHFRPRSGGEDSRRRSRGGRSVTNPAPARTRWFQDGQGALLSPDGKGPSVSASPPNHERKAGREGARRSRRATAASWSAAYGIYRVTPAAVLMVKPGLFTMLGPGRHELLRSMSSVTCT